MSKAKTINRKKLVVFVLPIIQENCCIPADKMVCSSLFSAVDGRTPAQIVNVFFMEIEKRYDFHLHFLYLSLHMSKGISHIYECYVFDCDEGYRYLKSQHKKSLVLLEIEPPYSTKSFSKRNNCKMTFDKAARDIFPDIC